ncbi:MAG TPA: hypothetical protein VMS54_01860 [Vicinamibacterales bacterium]|nr:hypothetical protein [Vicinamibacterales bacterium]
MKVKIFALALTVLSLAVPLPQSTPAFDPVGKWRVTTTEDGTPVSIELEIAGKPGGYSGHAFNGDDKLPLVDLATTPTGMIAMFAVRQGVIVVRMSTSSTGKITGEWGAMPEATPLAAVKTD